MSQVKVDVGDGPGRTSSPDSGCEVMAYTKEPKVRRVGQDSEGDTSDVSQGTDGSEKGCEMSAPIPAPRPTIQAREQRKAMEHSHTLPHPNHTHINPTTELNSPYSRSGLYSLEGNRLKCLPPGAGGATEEVRGRTSSGHSEDSSYRSRTMRSYASSRDILQMYGQGMGQKLTPRTMGFSSSDLRLPPGAMLLSLSGKKSNSALSVHWHNNANIYQNVPTKKKSQRDTIF
jgi:hypothetical protein